MLRQHNSWYFIMFHMPAIPIARANEHVPLTAWIFLNPRQDVFGCIFLSCFNFTGTEVGHLIVVLVADRDVPAAAV